MKSAAANLGLGIGLILAGLAVAAAGIYIRDPDDAPGAGLIGILLMMVAISYGARILQRRK